ncbi:hypothetical protein SOCE836_105530 [Sorangium cellulosum]|uniref:Secreted protein n=2 Tax=Polyangiaceae TaxID=49 RepID=A0A4V0NHY7_SORCE|nr:hypothetical protein SOCE836_105530 [Sorangium cellulosum]WCQ97599.1 hypothetical protein NQZ70_10393 [Sorangium sp. Soce836]
MRLLPLRLLALGLALAVVACGSAPSAAPVGAEAPPPPKPRNAAAIAQSIAGGKVSVLVFADRTRGHPIMARLAALDLWGPVLAGTGLDPERDLERAFVTAPRADAAHEAVIVLEHNVPPERLEAGLDTLLSRSQPPGAEEGGLGVPAVRVTLKGHTRVVATVEPNFLVVLPVSRAREARRFIGTGGFPDPVGEEAALAAAIDPARTLRGPREAPRVPPTLRSLEAAVTLTKDGGATVALDGASASPEDAARDAAFLNEEIERATSFRIAVVTVRVVDPVEFFAEGDRVKANRRVTPGEIDKLFALLSAVLPR